MSRIDTKPRYRNQAIKKFITNFAIARLDDEINYVLKLCHDKNLKDLFVKQSSIMVTKHLLNMYNILGEKENLNTEYMRNIKDNFDYTRVVEEILCSSLSRNFKTAKELETYTENLSISILEVLKAHEIKFIHNDSRAINELIIKELCNFIPHKEYSIDNYTKDCIIESLICQSLGQNISPYSAYSVFERSFINKGLNSRTKKLLGAYEAYFCITYSMNSAHVSKCRLACRDIRSKKKWIKDFIEEWPNMDPKEKFRINHKKFKDNWPDNYVYNFNGIIMIIYDKTAYIIDRSGVEQIWSRILSYAGMIMGLNDYYINRKFPDDCEDLNQLGEKVIKWIINSYNILHKNEDYYKFEYLARHMHICFNKILMECYEEDNEFSFWDEEKSKTLDGDMNEHFKLSESWYDFVKSIKVPTYLKFEIAKMYHLLICPDADGVAMVERVQNSMKNSNKVDKKEEAIFFKFCYAFDFAYFVKKNKRIPKHVKDNDYTFEDKRWFMGCMNGSLRIPPFEEWGKIRIFGEYDFIKTANNWFINCEDVTHVMANKEIYKHPYNSTDQTYHNELLYSFMNAPNLSNGKIADVVRDAIWENKTIKDVICVLAAKAENTKAGKKTRETYSACDIHREFQSENEYNLRFTRRDVPGVAQGQSAIKIKKRMLRMAKDLSSAIRYTNVGICADCSEWSPAMDREFEMKYNRYELEKTNAPKSANIDKLWDAMVMIFNKRGVYMDFEIPKGRGSCQGLPGTIDTALHAHIILYNLWTAVNDGIITADELGMIMTLIDDEAVVISLSSDRNSESKKKVIKELYEHIITKTKKLGFKIDLVKTIVSTVKYIFLNQLYVDGIFIPMALKTYMKMSYDRDSRMKSIFHRMRTRFDGEKGASSAGFDPWACYINATWGAMKMLFDIHKNAKNYSPLQIGILFTLPYEEGGFGMPTYLNFAGSEGRDRRSDSNHILRELVSVRSTYDVQSFIYNIKNRGWSKSSKKAILNNPFICSREGIKDSDQLFTKFAKKEARVINLSNFYHDFFRINSDKGLDKIIDELSNNTVFEAAIIKEIMGCIPSSLVNSVLAKVIRTEAIIPIIPRKKIGYLIRNIRYIDHQHIEYFNTLPRPNVEKVMKYNEYMLNTSASKIAFDERESFFNKNNIKIINHTYPCAFEVFAHMTDYVEGNNLADSYCEIAFHINDVTGGIVSKKGDYLIGRLKTKKFVGYNTIGYSLKETHIDKNFDKAYAMIAHAFAVIEFAENKGHNMEVIGKLVAKLWKSDAGPHDLWYDVPPPIAGTKRLASAPGSTKHTISMLPNTQGIVTVNLGSADIYLSRPNKLNDWYNHVISMRICALWELVAYWEKPSLLKNRYYGYKLSGIIDEDQTKMNCGVSNKLNELLDKITSFSNVRDQPYISLNLMKSDMRAIERIYKNLGSMEADEAYKNILKDGILPKKYLDSILDTKRHIPATFNPKDPRIIRTIETKIHSENVKRWEKKEADDLLKEDVMRRSYIASVEKDIKIFLGTTELESVKTIIETRIADKVLSRIDEDIEFAKIWSRNTSFMDAAKDKPNWLKLNEKTIKKLFFGTNVTLYSQVFKALRYPNVYDEMGEDLNVISSKVNSIGGLCRTFEIYHDSISNPFKGSMSSFNRTFSKTIVAGNKMKVLKDMYFANFKVYKKRSLKDHCSVAKALVLFSFSYKDNNTLDWYSMIIRYSEKAKRVYEFLFRKILSERINNKDKRAVELMKKKKYEISCDLIDDLVADECDESDYDSVVFSIISTINSRSKLMNWGFSYGEFMGGTKNAMRWIKNDYKKIMTLDKEIIDARTESDWKRIKNRMVTVLKDNRSKRMDENDIKALDYYELLPPIPDDDKSDDEYPEDETSVEDKLLTSNRITLSDIRKGLGIEITEVKKEPELTKKEDIISTPKEIKPKNPITSMFGAKKKVEIARKIEIKEPESSDKGTEKTKEIEKTKVEVKKSVMGQMFGTGKSVTKSKPTVNPIERMKDYARANIEVFIIFALNEQDEDLKGWSDNFEKTKDYVRDKMDGIAHEPAEIFDCLPNSRNKIIQHCKEIIKIYGKIDHEKIINKFEESLTNFFVWFSSKEDAESKKGELISE